jgi:hypothetical protein
MKRVRRTLRKYFIPQEENDHKPHILRAQSVAFVLVVALAVEGALWFGTSVIAPRSRLFGIIVANTLVDETNQNRVANGDPALTESPLLDAAAQDKANDMAANHYFAHTSPTGITPWDWFEQVGYGFTYAGENLAVNFSNSADVTSAWMNSPEHRANILNANFTQIGMATATGTYEGHPAIYVVEEFGTPVPPAPPADAFIPFVNTAAAAGGGAVAPVTASAPTKKVTTKKVAPTPTQASTRTSTPVVIASSDLQTASSNESFVAIQGAETSTLAATSTQATSSVSSTALALGMVANNQPPQSESNFIQTAIANPLGVVNNIYLAIIALFALALGINIFVKIRIQHAQVIFGGMLVILVAGLLIVLNQHVLGGAMIL